VSHLRLLTARGTAAACLVGLLTYAATGCAGLLVLFAFFLPSSLVSRASRPPDAGLDPKGETRDASQVFANGLAPAAGAAMAAICHQPGAAFLMLAGGLAAAAADTWATAIGSQSRQPPRSIATFRPVPRGANGGVTAAGTVGAALGALVVGLAGAGRDGSRIILAAVIIGLAGMLLDSLLGATLQGRYHCDQCRLPSERRIHRCGTRTRHAGGVTWLTNDGVNALATLAGTAGGALWWALSQHSF
jgi:uncharacterized protein (TIGR00297 family)